MAIMVLRREGVDLGKAIQIERFAGTTIARCRAKVGLSRHFSRSLPMIEAQYSTIFSKMLTYSTQGSNRIGEAN